MQEGKHLEALGEVDAYIEESLQAPELVRRQRLLMAALSLGMQHLVELWLHEARALKPGAMVKHEFFKAGERRLLLRLAGALTKDLQGLPDAGRILALAREIERGRDDIIYGAPLPSDRELREKVDLFFELKRAVEAARSRHGSA